MDEKKYSLYWSEEDELKHLRGIGRYRYNFTPYPGYRLHCLRNYLKSLPYSTFKLSVRVRREVEEMIKIEEGLYREFVSPTPKERILPSFPEPPH